MHIHIYIYIYIHTYHVGAQGRAALRQLAARPTSTAIRTQKRERQTPETEAFGGKTVEGYAVLVSNYISAQSLQGYTIPTYLSKNNPKLSSIAESSAQHCALARGTMEGPLPCKV